jgi:carboxynorspermidine decarboxylase
MNNKTKKNEMSWDSYDSERLKKLDLGKIKTPAYIIDEFILEKNLKILADVRKKTGCKILLAQKAFSAYSTYPLLRKYLDGVCASGLNEAMLGRDYFNKEVHVFAPAYSDEDFDKLVKISNHIILNSCSQLERFKKKIKQIKNVEFGIRLNPEYSEIEVELYNPAARYSHMGLRIEDLKGIDLSIVSGFHFHVLCEQNSDTLERVLKKLEKKFAKYLILPNIKWVNFGGGHHITRQDYDVDKLCKLINNFKLKYKKQVILEPGEAIGLNAGILVSSVLDIKQNEINIAIMDTSATAHMPDTLEMPYTPKIIDAGKSGEKKNTYRLVGATCLAGDVIGDYSFNEKLKIGSKLVFSDMANYTMVKNNTFNGINLPSIYKYTKKGKIMLIKSFGYKDFKDRLS